MPINWEAFTPVDELPPKPQLAGGEYNSPDEVDWSRFTPVQNLPPKTPSSRWRRYLADPALALARGVVSVPEAVVGLLDIPTLGLAGRALEAGGYGFQPKFTKEWLSSLESAELKAAKERVAGVKGFGATVKAMLDNPSTIVDTVVESVPLMFAGGAIGKGATAAAAARGYVFPRVAKLATKLGGKGGPAVGAAGLGEGAVGAGMAAEQMRQQRPSGLLTPAQSALAVSSGLATALLGVMGGRLAQRLGVDDIDVLVTRGASNVAKKSIFKRAIGSAISEGAFEELPQSVSEQLHQNVATGKPTMEGVLEAGAQGMLAGLAMGIAGGAGGAAAPKVKTAGAPEAPAPAAPAIGPKVPKMRPGETMLPGKQPPIRVEVPPKPPGAPGAPVVELPPTAPTAPTAPAQVTDERLVGRPELIVLSPEEAALGGREAVKAVADRYGLTWSEAASVLARERQRLGISKPGEKEVVPSGEEVQEEETVTEPAPVVEPAPGVVTDFVTELGSIYTLDQNRNASRFKKSPGKGQGEQFLPMPVVYLSPEAKDVIMEEGQANRRIIIGQRNDDGSFTQLRPEVGTDLSKVDNVYIVALDDAGNLTAAARTEPNPAIGLSPFQISYAGTDKVWHMGHKITEIGIARPVAPTTTAPAIREQSPFFQSEKEGIELARRTEGEEVIDVEGGAIALRLKPIPSSWAPKDAIFIFGLYSERKGAGTELMRLAAQRALELGRPLAWDKSPGAQGFYTALGFKPDKNGNFVADAQTLTDFLARTQPSTTAVPPTPPVARVVPASRPEIPETIPAEAWIAKAQEQINRAADRIAKNQAIVDDPVRPENQKAPARNELLADLAYRQRLLAGIAQRRKGKPAGPPKPVAALRKPPTVRELEQNYLAKALPIPLAEFRLLTPEQKAEFIALASSTRYGYPINENGKLELMIDANDRLVFAPPAAQQLAMDFTGTTEYTILNAVKDAGGIGGPPLEEAMKAMEQGKTAAQVVNEWSRGRGEYDALADVLSEIYEERNNKKVYKRLAQAYVNAGFGTNRRNVTNTKDALLEQGGIPGGRISDETDLIYRAWRTAEAQTGRRVVVPQDANERSLLFAVEVGKKRPQTTRWNSGAMQEGWRFKVRGNVFKGAEFVVKKARVPMPGTEDQPGAPTGSLLQGTEGIGTIWISDGTPVWGYDWIDSAGNALKEEGAPYEVKIVDVVSPRPELTQEQITATVQRFYQQAEEWMSGLKARTAREAGAANQYRRAVSEFIDFMVRQRRITEWSQVRPADIVAWSDNVMNRAKRGWDYSTDQRYRDFVGRFAEYLRNFHDFNKGNLAVGQWQAPEETDEEKAASIERREINARKFISAENLIRLFSFLRKSNDPKMVRLYAYLAIAANTGRRKVEILGLKISQLSELERGYLKNVVISTKGKGGGSRIAPLAPVNAMVIDAINRYRAVRNQLPHSDSEFLFQSEQSAKRPMDDRLINALLATVSQQVPASEGGPVLMENGEVPIAAALRATMSAGLMPFTNEEERTQIRGQAGNVAVSAFYDKTFGNQQWLDTVGRKPDQLPWNVDFLKEQGKPAAAAPVVPAVAQPKAKKDKRKSPPAIEPNIAQAPESERGMTVDEVAQIIESEDSGGFEIVYLTREQAAAIKPEAAGYAGFFFQGKIHLVPENMTRGDAEGVRSVLREEAAHGHLRSTAGRTLLDAAIEEGRINLTDEERQDLLRQGYTEDQLLREFIAKSASQNLPWWQRAVERVRGWLSKVGMVNLTNAELSRALLREIQAQIGAADGVAASAIVDTSSPEFNELDPSISSAGRNLSEERRQERLRQPNTIRISGQTVPAGELGKLDLSADQRLAMELFNRVRIPLEMVNGNVRIDYGQMVPTPDYNAEARGLLAIINEYEPERARLKEINRNRAPGEPQAGTWMTFLKLAQEFAADQLQRIADGDPSFVTDPQLLMDIEAAAHEPPREIAQMLNLLRQQTSELEDMSRNPYLAMTNHLGAKLFGSGWGAVRDILRRVAADFSAYFTPQEIESIAREDAELTRMFETIAARVSSIAARIRGTRTAQLFDEYQRPKYPPKYRNLRNKAIADEAFAEMVQRAEQIGNFKAPEKRGRTLTPREKLSIMASNEGIEQVDEAWKLAIWQKEREAARDIWIDEEKPEEAQLALYDQRTRDPQTYYDRPDETADPTLDQIARGVDRPRYAGWKVVREITFPYSPATQLLIEKVLKGDFKGLRFPNQNARVQPPKIDFALWARSPDEAVEKYISEHWYGQYDEDGNKISDGLIDIFGPDTLEANRERIEEQIRMTLLDQLEIKRLEIVNNFFKPKENTAPKTASKRLRELINAKIEQHQLFDTEPTKRLIRRVVNDYTDNREIRAVATGSIAEKQKWLDDSTDAVLTLERLKVMPGNPMTTEAAAFYEAVARRYLVERLQLKEAQIISGFMRGTPVNYVRGVTTPEELARRMERSIKVVRDAIQAGALRLPDAEQIDAIASRRATAKLLPAMREMMSKILSTPVNEREAYKKLWVRYLVEKLNIDPTYAEAAGKVFETAFAEKQDAALKESLEKAQKSLTPFNFEKIFGERTKLWEKLANAVKTGALTDFGVLREIARMTGSVTMKEDIAALEKLVERLDELVKLSPVQIQRLEAAGITEEKIKRYDVTGEISETPDGPSLTQDQVNELKLARETARAARLADIQKVHQDMVVRWSRMYRPFGKFLFGESSPEARVNRVEAMNNLSAFNVIFRLPFFFKQLFDVAGQGVLHMITTPMAHASYRMATPGMSEATALDWTREYANALRDHLQWTLSNLKSGAWAAVHGLRTGKGLPQRVEGISSSLHPVERAFLLANELMAKGDPVSRAQAIPLLLLSKIGLGMRYAASLDAFQFGVHRIPEILAAVKTQLYREGANQAEIKTYMDGIMEDINTSFALAQELGPELLQASGVKPTQSALAVAQSNIVFGRLMERLRQTRIGPESVEIMRQEMVHRMQTLGWNEPSNSGIAKVIAIPMREAQRWLARQYIPTGNFTNFGNAIAYGIEQVISLTPIPLLFPQFLKGSPLMATAIDRLQTRHKAALGTAVQMPLILAIASGLMKVIFRWPDDKKERAMMEAAGIRPGMVLIKAGNDKYVSFSLSSGPLALLRPGLVVAQSIYDKNIQIAKKQEALNREAERLGVRPQQAESWTIQDIVNVIARGIIEGAAGTRTASGKLGSVSEYQELMTNKSVAGYVSAYMPFLPLVNSASQMAGVDLNPRLADVADLLLPLPTSGARRVNIFGEPVTNYGDVNNLLTRLSGGTGGVYDMGKQKQNLAYANVMATGYVPPLIQPNKPYIFNGQLRPMTQSELQKYTVIRGKMFAEEVRDLGLLDTSDESVKAMRSAYQRANARALAEMGAEPQQVPSAWPTTSATKADQPALQPAETAPAETTAGMELAGPRSISVTRTPGATRIAMASMPEYTPSVGGYGTPRIRKVRFGTGRNRVRRLSIGRSRLRSTRSRISTPRGVRTRKSIYFA